MADGQEPELDEELEEAGADGPAPPDADADPKFRQLLEKLYAEHHFDFRQYKEASLVRRVRRRMAQVHVDTVDDYLTFLDRHRGEHTALLNTVLINVTRFFRDPEAWNVLRETVLPSLIEQAASTRTLRMWSAGCSSGEEPYTLAMLLAETLGVRKEQFEVKIYATDIDDDALATARAGLYRLEQLKDIPRELLERHFIAEGHAFRVRRSLRKWCIFGRHDLTQDAPFSHMDLVLCRNVLIYFDGELQDRVLPRFQYAVRNGGYLFLGRSESLLARSRRFVPVDLKWRIFKRAVHVGGDAQLARPLVEDPPARKVPPSRPEVSPLQRNDVIETLTSAIIVIDPAETIVAWNAAAAALFEIPADHAVGKKFRDLDVSYRIDGLRARVEGVRATHAAVQMQDIMFARRSGSEMVHANIRVAPIFDEQKRSAGVVVSGEDISEVGRLRDELDRLAEQSATANEELQSTNEELETTNEELQSTNEELETTNEELQSTNEELEATIEELQSMNAELATLNTELERRTTDLNRLEGLQRGVLDRLGMALFILDPESIVTHWNGAATRLWGLRPEAALGREFFALPIGDGARDARAALRRVTETHAPERLGPWSYGVAGDGQRETMLELTAILSPAGELLGILGVATDDGVAADDGAAPAGTGA